MIDPTAPISDIGSLDVNAIPASFTFTPAAVDVTSDPNATAQGGMGQGIANFFGGLAALFTGGVAAYNASLGQYAAAQKITQETLNPKPTTVLAPSTSILNQSTLIKMGLVVVVGALALYLVRKR
jgi:hypothetical protein